MFPYLSRAYIHVDKSQTNFKQVDFNLSNEHLKFFSNHKRCIINGSNQRFILYIEFNGLVSQLCSINLIKEFMIVQCETVAADSRYFVVSINSHHLDYTPKKIFFFCYCMHTLINRNEFNLRTLCIYKNDFAECYLTAHKVKFCITIPKGKQNFFCLKNFHSGLVLL